MFKTASYPSVDPAPIIINGAWFTAAGCRENTPVAVEKPKKKAFSLVKIMSLGSKKGHGQQQQQSQQQQRRHHHNNNNMPFNIHCHIGKEIKHICSNCSRANDTQDGEWRRVPSPQFPSSSSSPSPSRLLTVRGTQTGRWKVWGGGVCRYLSHVCLSRSGRGPLHDLHSASLYNTPRQRPRVPSCQGES